LIGAPIIDDPDNARVSRHFDRMKRKARLLAAHEEHALTDTGAHGINGNQLVMGATITV